MFQDWIVQDIAILKAKNIDIISTNRGYRLLSKGIKKVIKVKHDDAEIRNELNAIVDLGASVEDVFVIHKTYGEIRVKLDIKSRRDVDLLVENINSKLSKPLKNLTDNCHYHTIIAENENIFKEVEEQVKRTWNFDGRIKRKFRQLPFIFVHMNVLTNSNNNYILIFSNFYYRISF